MKKDIPENKVEGVYMAVVKQTDDVESFHWNVYLINANNYPIENVLVTSKGYGKNEGEDVKTSILRHMFEVMAPHSSVLVEPIDPKLFALTNEYWVSYYIEREIYDKKFLFVPDSIVEENVRVIQDLNMKGVLHS